MERRHWTLAPAGSLFLSWLPSSGCSRGPWGHQSCILLARRTWPGPAGWGALLCVGPGTATCGFWSCLVWEQCCTFLQEWTWSWRCHSNLWAVVQQGAGRKSRGCWVGVRCRARSGWEGPRVPWTGTTWGSPRGSQWHCRVLLARPAHRSARYLQEEDSSKIYSIIAYILKQISGPGVDRHRKQMR